MINSPLENAAKFSWLGWKQVRPKITQGFGEDFIWTDGKLAYARFGLDGHNGIDLRAKVGTPVYAPTSGMVKIKNDKSAGYGLHISMRRPWATPLEIKLGHLSECDESLDGKIVNTGTFLGRTGNTGFSDSAHLHFGLRFLIPRQDEVIDFIVNPDKRIFDWEVKNKNNGYAGYENPFESTIAFKGTLLKTSIF